MLSKLFGKEGKRIIGYIYVEHGDEGVLKNISAGQTIRNKKKGSPWVVVDHVIKNMNIAKWPGSGSCLAV